MIEMEKLESHGRETEPDSSSARNQLELALTFPSRSWKIWGKGRSHMRRMVPRLVFSERLEY